MNRSHDETSTALLSAAHRLLAESGPESLTVRRIATEAGMSTMNVYSRFGGKDGVIDELYADGYRRLIAAIEAVPVTDDIPADLEHVAHAYRDFAIQNPTYYSIMFQSAMHQFEPSQTSVELGLSSLNAFVDRVEAGQAAGTIITPSDCSAVDIAAWLWATCHGLISLELDHVGVELVSWPTIFEAGIRTTIAALRPAVAASTV